MPSSDLPHVLLNLLRENFASVISLCIIPYGLQGMRTHQEHQTLDTMAFEIVLSLLTTLSLLAAGIFAGLQIRQLMRQRSREYSMQLLHSFQTPEFQEAVTIVADIPEGMSKKELENHLGARMTSMLVMFGTFEALGVLVKRGEISIDLVEDFFSGVVILAWRKFKNYILELRENGHRPTYYEWFQWLDEQIEKREAKEPAIPAHLAFRDWES